MFYGKDTQPQNSLTQNDPYVHDLKVIILRPRLMNMNAFLEMMLFLTNRFVLHSYVIKKPPYLLSPKQVLYNHAKLASKENPFVLECARADEEIFTSKLFYKKVGHRTFLAEKNHFTTMRS